MPEKAPPPEDVNEEPYVEYVMIAEPALTVALSQNNSVSIYTDIQEEYKQKSNGLVITQASVFVSNRLSKQKAQTYLDSLQSGVSELLSNPSLFSDSVANLEDVEVKEIFGDEIDFVLEGEAHIGKATTIVSLSNENPELIREGPIDFIDIVRTAKGE